MKKILRKIWPHLGALAIFFVASSLFYYPAWQGKEVRSSDRISFIALSHPVQAYNDTARTPTMWHPGLFAGMPTYLITNVHSGPTVRPIQNIGWFFASWMPSLVLEGFMMMTTFYVLMLLLGASVPAAIAAALAFGFSSNNIILLKAGHSTKAWAILWAPLVLGFTYWLFKRARNPWLPAALLAMAMGWELLANHLQVTYHLFLLIGLFLAYQLWQHYRSGQLPRFFIRLGLWVVAIAIAVGINIVNIAVIRQYSKDTMRGGTELKRHIRQEGAIRQQGLSRDYAFRWSYGIDETLTLLVPNFKGGGSAGAVPDDGAVARFLRGKASPAEIRKTLANMPTYWGEQPFTEGPIYLGAIVVFLFVFGMFYSRDPMKWWVLAGVVLAIMMAWGRHFPLLNNLLFEYLPFYNKFRVPSMILWLVSLLMPMWGFLVFDRILRGDYDRPRFFRALKYALGLVGGLLVLAIVAFPSMYDFRAPGDAGLPEWLRDLLPQDRAALMRQDALRSLIFVAITAALLWLWERKKLKRALVYLTVGLLSTADLWAVGRRYIRPDEFVPKRTILNPVPLTAADRAILKDPDRHYRVLNVSRNPWNDALTSYYHRHVGGYHAAKLQRYQDLIDYHLTPEIQQYIARGKFDSATVLNMLDTRYFILGSEATQILRNPAAAGAAWFVDTVEIVPDADAELDALYGLPFRRKAVMDARFKDHIPWKAPRLTDRFIVYPPDTQRRITLEDYQPNIVRYRVRAGQPAFVVFSEVYYNDTKGWKAYLDGKSVPHVRVNYILRGMEVPSGEHRLEFRFEPRLVQTTRKIAWAANGLLLLLLIVGFFYEWRQRGGASPEAGR